MSRKPIRRNCRCCRKFFTPDPFNSYHQVFCSKPDCQRASKAASQRRWARKPHYRNYIRDEVERVQAWRKKNPGYWKKKKKTSTSETSQPIDVKDVNQDTTSTVSTQHVDVQHVNQNKTSSEVTQAIDYKAVNPDKSSRNVPEGESRTLRDFAITEHPAFVGLISMVTGSTLRDDIAATSRQLLIQGQNILGLAAQEKLQTSTMPKAYDRQTPHPTGSSPPSPQQLQLDRPPLGSP
jgi:hypothetical protein